MFDYQVAPKSKVQQKFADNTLEHMIPDAFAVQKASATIIKVYDTETIQEEGVPQDLALRLAESPGFLFGIVQIGTSTQKYLLPFKDSEEYVYSTYGNRIQLNGRKVMIEYPHQNIENGVITFQRVKSNFHLPLSNLSMIYDIGGIV